LAHSRGIDYTRDGVLPEQFSKDSEMEQRFEREAQTIAARNHPQTAGVGQNRTLFILGNGK